MNPKRGRPAFRFLAAPILVLPVFLAAQEAAPTSCVVSDFDTEPGWDAATVLGVTQDGSRALIRRRAGSFWVSDGTSEGTRAIAQPCGDEDCFIASTTTGWLFGDYRAPLTWMTWYRHPEGELISPSTSSGLRLAGSQLRKAFESTAWLYLDACAGELCGIWAVEKATGVGEFLSPATLQDAIQVGEALVVVDSTLRLILLRARQPQKALGYANSQLRSDGRYGYFLSGVSPRSLHSLDDFGTVRSLATVAAPTGIELTTEPTGGALLTWDNQGKLEGILSRGTVDTTWKLPAFNAGSLYGVSFVGALGDSAIVKSFGSLWAWSATQARLLSKPCTRERCSDLQAVLTASRLVLLQRDGSVDAWDGRSVTNLRAPCSQCELFLKNAGPRYAFFEIWLTDDADGIWATDGTTSGTWRLTQVDPDDVVWLADRVLALPWYTSRRLSVLRPGSPPEILQDWPAAGSAYGPAPANLASVPFGVVGSVNSSAGDFFSLPTPGQPNILDDWRLTGWWTATSLANGEALLATREGFFALSAASQITPLDGPQTDPYRPTVPVLFQGKAHWVGEGWLWQSDGTNAGTQERIPIGDITALSPLGQRLLLLNRGGVSVTDGTTNGTEPLLLGSDPAIVVTAGTRALLSATRAGRWLWSTDGSPSGTERKIRFGATGAAAALGQQAVFSGFRTDRPALFLWDGDRISGLMRLSDQANEMAAGGAWAVFANSTDATGHELWVTNGTRSGTRLLADLWPGPVGARPAGFRAVPGGVVFSAQHPLYGREPWFTDGTPGGTRLLADIWPGAESSLPSDFIAKGSSLYLIATDGTHGRELHMLRLDGQLCQ